MTITYTFQYRFLPKKWSVPKPTTFNEEKVEDLAAILEYRLLVAPYIKGWLSVLHTWMVAMKYGIPLLLLAYFLGFVGLVTFLILSFIVAIICVVIWVKIKILHRTVAFLQILIDEIIFIELGVRLPKILDNE